MDHANLNLSTTSSACLFWFGFFLKEAKGCLENIIVFRCCSGNSEGRLVWDHKTFLLNGVYLESHFSHHSSKLFF